MRIEFDCQDEQLIIFQYKIILRQSPLSKKTIEPVLRHVSNNISIEEVHQQFRKTK